jgi:hypothetical protein
MKINWTMRPEPERSNQCRERNARHPAQSNRRATVGIASGNAGRQERLPAYRSNFSVIVRGIYSTGLSYRPRKAFQRMTAISSSIFIPSFR